MQSYFEALPDGRKIFYPWGRFWRGYVVNSERDFARLRSQTTLYISIGLGLVFGVSHWKGNLAGLGILGVWLLVYLLWMRYLLHELKPYDTSNQLQTARNSEHASPE